MATMNVFEKNQMKSLILASAMPQKFKLPNGMTPLKASLNPIEKRTNKPDYAEHVKEINRCKNLMALNHTEKIDCGQWKTYDVEFNKLKKENDALNVDAYFQKILKFIMNEYHVRDYYQTFNLMCTRLDHELILESITAGDSAMQDRQLVQKVYEKNFEDLWRFAADTLYIHHYDKDKDISNEEYATIIGQNYSEMLFYITLRLQTLVHQTLNEKNNNTRSNKSLKKKLSEQRSALNNIEKENETQKLKIDRQSNYIQTLEAELEGKRREINRIQYEYDKLLSELNQEEVPETIPDAADEKCEAGITAPVNAEEFDYDSVELPNTNKIWMLGGHPQFVAKVRERYPEWRFVNPNDYKSFNSIAESASQAMCVIVYTAFVSHKTLGQFNRYINSDCKMIYYTELATNFDKFEKFVKSKWTVSAEKNNEFKTKC